MAPILAPLNLSFVRYTQITDAWSWLCCWFLCQLVKFTNNSSELLLAWSFVTNTCYVFRFQCRWFHVNPIPGLRDIVELLKVAWVEMRNRESFELSEWLESFEWPAVILNDLWSWEWPVVILNDLLNDLRSWEWPAVIRMTFSHVNDLQKLPFCHRNCIST